MSEKTVTAGVVHHAVGVSEPSPVPATAPVVTGTESRATNGSVTHPKVVGTTNNIAFSNPS